MSHSQTSIQTEPSAGDGPLDLTSITAEEIQEWLVEQIADQIGHDPDDIDIQLPFNRYGLDSVQAMAITSLGQQQFGVKFSPLVMWNYPNVASLSEYLVNELTHSEVEFFEL